VTLLEYCNGGSLLDLLHKRKVKLSTQQQLEIALKIAEGMEYLHTRDPMIVHRDLKSENIVVHKLKHKHKHKHSNSKENTKLSVFCLFDLFNGFVTVL
jgi:serine/threonine protein kinase